MSAAAIVVAGAACLPAAAQADFGLKSMTAGAFNQDGSVDLQAGSHPYQFKLAFAMNLNAAEEPEGTLRELTVDLPPGMVGNPLAVPRCSGADFEGASSKCPGDTQIGVVRITLGSFTGGNHVENPIYNLTPPQGVPASIGFSLVSNNVFNEASLRPADYGVRISDITLPTSVEIQSVDARIWGLPAAAAHDPERQCIIAGKLVFGCASNTEPRPFLSLPTSCGDPLQWTLAVKSVQEPEAFITKSALSEDEGTPFGLDGCNALEFEPTISAQPTTNLSDTPTGLDFNLHQPQDAEPEGLSTAHLKDTTVTLPAGVTLNPAAAAGLEACTEAQIGYLPEAHHYTAAPQSCPEASKIGTLEATSPLVDHPLQGAVYVAAPFQNPFGSLTAIYLAVEDPQTGTIVKLGGRAELDPQSGQITNVFADNPQLPIEDIALHLFKGPRAILKTPLACATHTTTSTLVPWSAPEGEAVTPGDSFPTSVAAGGGGSCPKSEAEAPNAPTFTAGTVAPQAGAFSPFVLKLIRTDGSQRLAGLETKLPPGLAGKLAGLATCTEAQIAAAKAREAPKQGALELASPSCPAASEVGTITVGAGAGLTPYYVTAHAYLAGPYKSAPLSLVVIAPAVAGPFDLGTVVVRVALRVDPETAQISALSDPLPAILDGIPLDVRSIALDLSHPQFTLNPTSCEESSITGAARSLPGQIAPLAQRFQVGGCESLPYKPKLSLRLKGATKRTANPKLIATLTAKPGEANTAFAQVKLPRSAFLDNAHIGTVCTRPQFAAEACPPGSVYGRAEAITPLLGYPLQGKVYLRANPAHKLPDLVVSFKGPDYQPIKFALAGKTDSVKGALRNTFEAAPDVPVSKFRLELFGGKRGLVELSSGFCARPEASVRLRAHNGKSYEAHPRVQASCGGTHRPGAHGENR